jgi:MFS superfamily sulfate permease-like transporter
VPDRFLIVVLSAVLAWRLNWESKGLDILGDIKTKGKPFPVSFPLGIEHLKNASDAFSTSFVIALLGFFESSVAAKSLGVGQNKKTGAGGIRNMHMSPNRELVALGVANVLGGLFMALPAFGGYGRSKVNASTGGRTPMSSIFLSLITVISVLVMLPWFYYLPVSPSWIKILIHANVLSTQKGVLSAMVSVVAYSLLEEAPPDIIFFIRLRDVSSLLLMSLIFLCTIFWNLKIGIAVGIGLSILRVLKHSTRPRIQILGRVPGTTDKFENAERAGVHVEFVEGVLIVKIPEPLTFANTGDLKGRLRRLEEHGTGKAHPALPPVRHTDHNRNVVFDIHGVTSLDGAGAQILMEIVRGYRERGVRVFFCRVPAENSHVWVLMERSGIVDLCRGKRHFVSSVAEALRLTELEEELEGGGEEGRRSSGRDYGGA